VKTDLLLVPMGARYTDTYLKRDSPARASLERLGVERLILLMEPPFDQARLREAGRLLDGSR